MCQNEGPEFNFFNCGDELHCFPNHFYYILIKLLATHWVLLRGRLVTSVCKDLYAFLKVSDIYNASYTVPPHLGSVLDAKATCKEGCS